MLGVSVQCICNSWLLTVSLFTSGDVWLLFIIIPSVNPDKFYPRGLPCIYFGTGYFEGVHGAKFLNPAHAKQRGGVLRRGDWPTRSFPETASRVLKPSRISEKGSQPQPSGFSTATLRINSQSH